MIAGYRGYASAERVLVLGRVLKDAPVAPSQAAASWWRNLIDTINRIDSDPIAHARVRVTIGGAEHQIAADDEGFLRAWLPLSTPLSGESWHRVALEYGGEAQGRVTRDHAMVLAPSERASFGVISDLDDTVLQSRVTSFLRAAQLILLENARTRLPFPGVAAFYRALECGVGGRPGKNPIFYVSSSPWNLYDVIVEFLGVQSIPLGPVLLRDWDIGRSLLKNREHKTRLIHEILSAYPTLPFILVGDSTQEDPEIYAEVVRQYPGRILAVYVRNVSAPRERTDAIGLLAADVSTAGSTLVLADDTLAVARHAAMKGWIEAAALDEIARDKASDEGLTGEKIDAPGVETPSAPTVVVDEELDASDVE